MFCEHFTFIWTLTIITNFQDVLYAIISSPREFDTGNNGYWEQTARATRSYYHFKRLHQADDNITIRPHRRYPIYNIEHWNAFVTFVSYIIA